MIRESTENYIMHIIISSLKCYIVLSNVILFSLCSHVGDILRLYILFSRNYALMPTLILIVSFTWLFMDMFDLEILGKPCYEKKFVED